MNRSGWVISITASLMLVACFDKEEVAAAKSASAPEQKKSVKNTSPKATQETATPALSYQLPASWPVNQPSSNPADDTAAFDDYSWKTFIALAWPADVSDPYGRGKPNTSANFLVSNQGGVSNTPTVFMSYRDVTMLFPPQSGMTPVDWYSQSGPYSATNPGGYYSPCSSITGTPSSVDYLKDSIATDTNQAGAPYPPLVDQNGNYARYEIKMNEVEYTYTKANKLYVQTSTPVTLPLGSIEFKATWREMTADDDLSRYYVVEVPTLDPNAITLSGDSGACTVKQMGLVGLHINSKPASQYFASATVPSQWIFSTFEQIDNIAPAGQKGSFSNGAWSAKNMLQGYDHVPDSLPVSAGTNNMKPVNVYRTTPINATTVSINQQYQQAVKGTVWEYYQLIATQWPAQPTQTAKLGVPFPDQYVANAVIETFAQGNASDSSLPGSTCMGCHSAAINEDFSWSMKARARKAE